MRLPTASSVDMALACEGPGVLPSVDEEHEYSAGGNALHYYLDAARKKGKAQALLEAPEDEREWLATLDLAALPAEAESEVALGWDPVNDVGVRYALAGARRYPDDGLYHGTADLIGVLGQRVVVGDYKRYGAKRRAKESGQLGLLALAGTRLAGLAEAEVMMLQPTSKGWRVDRAVLDAFDLASWAERFIALAARLAAFVPGTLPRLAVGGHCQYCPSLRYCPAQAAMVRHVGSMELATLEERVAALSAEEAGQLYERVLLVEKVAEKAKKALQNRARQTPIPLPGGLVLREVKWTQTVQSDVAKEELGALKRDLERRGEITKERTTQVRAVLPTTMTSVQK